MNAQTASANSSSNVRAATERPYSVMSDVPRVMVDISGSIRGRSIAAARGVAADLLLNYRGVDLAAFGDSVVAIGVIHSVAESDSLLRLQPRNGRTRLANAILSVLDTVSKPHRTRLSVIISDFAPDDDANEALRYLPSGHPRVARDADSVTMVSGGLALGGRELSGVCAAAVGAGVLLGLAFGRREERSRHADSMGRRVRVLLRGRSGRTLRDIPLHELTQPMPLFVTSADSRHRPFALADASDLELAASVAKNGATIIVTLRGASQHPSINGGNLNA